MLGYEQHPYNALMNDYDRGLTVDIVDKCFCKPETAIICSA
jgi:Zn-dependent M32 family carboxypeptidase